MLESEFDEFGGDEDDEKTLTYGTSLIHASDVSYEYISNQKICIIDSGLDMSHPSFAGRQNIDGWAFEGLGPWEKDISGHGTFVAGIIGAESGNETGMNGVIRHGQLPLHIAKIQQHGKIKTKSWTCVERVFQALNSCIRSGANIINMSIYLSGGPENRNECIGTAIAREVKWDKVLIVAAAGNKGDESLSYPASFNGVLSVASIDEERDHSLFSQKNNEDFIPVE